MRREPHRIATCDMRHARIVGRIPHSAFRISLIGLLAGCSWFSDFKQQPKLDPWETAADTIAMRYNPQGSVPITGSIAPGFAYERAATIAAINAMASLTNPVAADQRSLRNGAQQYQINCSVCHGPAGAGDGPVTKFGYPPMPIGAGSNAANTLSDGYIFGIIRNGRGLMPPYNRIEEPDRWDLINYLRALQSGNTALPANVLGLPGETGRLLPGASLTGPTRPAPFFRPGAEATVPVGAPQPANTPAASQSRPAAAATRTPTRPATPAPHTP
jgi:mono/diheme cytochrome c family protein